ncbi:MAG: hypothetical protein ACFFD4_17490 [Candidatus Odinarchaeota archaeon]
MRATRDKRTGSAVHPGENPPVVVAVVVTVDELLVGVVVVVVEEVDAAVTVTNNVNISALPVVSFTTRVKL